ncbi:MAG TPA: glycosyltransferase family 2 protein [Beijerinckiaceae bacterium]|jgi:phosphoglycerol transferase
MDIALIDSWPNLVDSAEAAFIRRFRRAAEKLGHRAFAVVTSDDVEACNPDFVIALDEISPKLTGVPTFGAMWTPPLLHHREPRRLRSILSYDGYLVGSGPIRSCLRDIEFSLGIEKPKSDFLFLPTASFEDRLPPGRGRWELGYGVRGGDDRPERDLVAMLEAAGLLESSPEQVSEDGGLGERGVALCLHTDAQRGADVPSARLFEAAAAGAVIVTDELAFARRVLRDAVLYIDPRAGHAEAVERVRRHLAWLNEDPARGERLAAAAREALRDEFDLEVLVARCCAFAQSVIGDARQARTRALRSVQKAEPVPIRVRERAVVDVIVRAGERPPEVLGRALRAIARQDGGSYRAIVVDYKGNDELRAFAEGFRTQTVTTAYVRSADTGCRSTALWTGLARVEAPFFAILDDDDTVAPDHFPSLVELASRHPETGFFYGGTVRVEDEGAAPAPPNFAGPLGLDFAERRELQFLDPHDLSRLAAFDNYITSNAFIARRELLDATVLEDPQLEVGEDVYLLLLLAARTGFRSTFRATAYWHWRSVARDNSMVAVASERWQRAVARISHRLGHVRLPAEAPLFKLRDDRPFVLPLGAFVDFNHDVLARSESGSLNPGEPGGGVWTSTTRSFIRLLLGGFVQEGRVVLEFMASGAADSTPQNVRISVDDQPVYSGPVDPWKPIRVEAPLKFARSRNVVILRVECDATFSPMRASEASKDERDLGMFLSKIMIEGAEPRKASRAGQEAKLAATLLRRRGLRPEAHGRGRLLAN